MDFCSWTNFVKKYIHKFQFIWYILGANIRRAQWLAAHWLAPPIEKHPTQPNPNHITTTDHGNPSFCFWNPLGRKIPAQDTEGCLSSKRSGCNPSKRRPDGSSSPFAVLRVRSKLFTIVNGGIVSFFGRMFLNFSAFFSYRIVDLPDPERCVEGNEHYVVWLLLLCST